MAVFIDSSQLFVSIQTAYTLTLRDFHTPLASAKLALPIQSDPAMALKGINVHFTTFKPSKEVRMYFRCMVELLRVVDLCIDV